MCSQLSEAIRLASLAHDGQLDKAGKSYILHPLRVMLRMDTEDEMIVAVLHDVVEDTDYTLNDLRIMFSPIIVDAVDAISQRKGSETYFEYIARCKQNPLARKVKIADILDNSSPDRAYLPESERLSMNRRYDKAFHILQDD